MLLVVDIKKGSQKRSLIKQKPLLCINRQQLKLEERFTELINNFSDLPKSEIFVYFTKITAATWSINKIIPVSIVLVLPSKSEKI